MSRPATTKSINITSEVGRAGDDSGDDYGHQFTGYLTDLPDARDIPLYPPVLGTLAGAPDVERTAALPDPPPNAEVEGWAVPTFTQQPYSSCASCAVVSVVEYLTKSQDAGTAFSRRFLYYNTRNFQQRYPGGNAPDCTMGTGIRNVLKALNKDGICTEDLCPYGGVCTDKPSEEAYDKAEFAGSVAYRRIFRLGLQPGDIDLDPFRRAVVDDTPPIIGFSVYESFKDAALNGRPIPIPSRTESLKFGHAAVIIKYEQTREHGELFTCVNSWGPDQGDGRFLLPADYLRNSLLVRDAWSLTSVTGGAGSADVQPTVTSVLKPG